MFRKKFMQQANIQKLAYHTDYSSSYDYTIYDINFVFCDEEELENESLYPADEDYAQA